MNGIFFLTYNGYYNYTTGIGTQTKLFLGGIDAHYERYKSLYGDFEINLVVPQFDVTVDGFDNSHIAYADNVINRFGGKVYVCDSAMEKGDDGFWTVSNWRRLTLSVASIVSEKSQDYERTIVIAVDPPYLHVPRFIEMNKKNNADIQSVILMYTSSYIHNKQALSFEKLGWEYQGLVSARVYKNIHIGDVCRFMTHHLVEHYGADRTSFVPYPSSLLFEDAVFDELPQKEANAILDKYNIPRNKDIVFAFGRASWIKGFDILVESLQFLEKDIHLVLVAVPFEIEPINYETIIKKSGLSYTLITKFTRDLPPALCQCDRCKIVVCPSRGEPFSNIPLEVSLWGKNRGPVVLASNVDGFLEQIEDGENGFLFNVNSVEDLADRINAILQMSDRTLANVRKSAYSKVIKERSFKNNFGLLLNALWGEK
ncbi:glycosyltransferase family 4 protein [Patescibacteria group bacterium]|nr:glycosyltransferase family 4 protein [Patescibacteria group bacterium]